MEDKTDAVLQPPVATQRAGVFAEISLLLEEMGVDPAAALAGTGLSQLPNSPDDRVPFAAGLKVLERAAELTSCPHLGLLLGQRFRLAHHGPVGELMRCAPTLGRALLDFTAWQPGYSSGAVVYLHKLGDDHVFGYGATRRGNRILYDLVMAIGSKMLDQLTGFAVRPEEIHFSHREPRDKTPYARYMNAPVRFNTQRVGLVLSRASLETRLPGADRTRQQDVAARLRNSLRSHSQDAATRTRHVLRILLQQGPPSMSAAAAELAMHPRTLRRRLAREHTRFDALCDEVRFAMARELLDLTDLPVGEIGAALAYASPSVFSDAFRRWSGLSPSAWRARTAPAPAPTSTLAFHPASD